MKVLGLDLAVERLEIEERLIEAEHRAQERASLAARHRAQEQAVARLVDSWDSLDFNRRRSMLRDAVDRIAVKDDGVKVLLRP